MQESKLSTRIKRSKTTVKTTNSHRLSHGRVNPWVRWTVIGSVSRQDRKKLGWRYFFQYKYYNWCHCHLPSDTCCQREWQETMENVITAGLVSTRKEPLPVSIKFQDSLQLAWPPPSWDPIYCAAVLNTSSCFSKWQLHLLLVSLRWGKLIITFDLPLHPALILHFHKVIKIHAIAWRTAHLLINYNCNFSNL